MPDNIYAKGAPVLISAGALLKDNQTNNVLVQLKITNLSHSVINACKVSVKAYDPSGEELQGVENYSYLDINVSRGKQFGTKKPIDLPDSTTRKIKPISVDHIVGLLGERVALRAGGVRPFTVAVYAVLLFLFVVVQMIILSLCHGAF